MSLSPHRSGPVDAYGLPPLDCHAHIATDVTHRQLATLDGAHVFAVTRSLDEAQAVQGRNDPNLTWGIGVHPGLAAARTAYSPDRFRELLPSFALVGEVGLDKRVAKDEQKRILNDIMDACHNEPVILSIHSTGMTSAVVDLVEQDPHLGAILHWWLGTPTETDRAIAADVYFSVNTGIDDQRLGVFPRNRVLPETDFPAKQVRARTPGQVAPLEARLAHLWDTEVADVRRQMWTNLRDITVRSGALDRLSDAMADLLLTA